MDSETASTIFGFYLMGVLIGAAIVVPLGGRHGWLWRLLCTFFLGWIPQGIINLIKIGGDFLTSPLPPLWWYWFCGPFGWAWYYTRTRPRQREEARRRAAAGTLGTP